MEEARAALACQAERDRVTARRFFHPHPQAQNSNSGTTSTTDDSYHPSDTSDEQTILTTYTSMTLAPTISMSEDSTTNTTKSSVQESNQDTNNFSMDSGSNTTHSSPTANAHVFNSAIPTSTSWEE
jgi:hypothetical protein